MKLSRELGLPLNDLLGWPGPLTARQVAAWQQWHLRDLNDPGKVETYLMAIAADIRRLPSHVWGKRSDVTLESCKVSFVPKPPEKPLTPEQLEQKRKDHAAYSRAAWRALFQSQRDQASEKQVAAQKTDEELLYEEAVRAIEQDKASQAGQGVTDGN